MFTGGLDQSRMVDVDVDQGDSAPWRAPQGTPGAWAGIAHRTRPEQRTRGESWTSPGEVRESFGAAGGFGPFFSRAEKNPAR